MALLLPISHLISYVAFSSEVWYNHFSGEGVRTGLSHYGIVVRFFIFDTESEEYYEI